MKFRKYRRSHQDSTRIPRWSSAALSCRYSINCDDFTPLCEPNLTKYPSHLNVHQSRGYSTIMQHNSFSAKRTLTEQQRDFLVASNQSPSRQLIPLKFTISVLTPVLHFVATYEVHRQICQLVFEALQHVLGRVSGDNERAYYIYR
jgi:hypothetical protein